MKRLIKPMLCVAAAAVLSLSMMQTAFAAPFNYYSFFPSRYGTTSRYTTAKPTTTQSTTKSTAYNTSASTNSGSTSAESQMLSMINEDRADAGLQPLRADSGLRSGALKHSQDMAKNNFFSHTSPTNGTFSQRASGTGASAENLAMYGSIAKAHASLMGSEGHRKNLMNASYTRIGIGIVYNSSKGAYYITQWFGR